MALYFDNLSNSEIPSNERQVELDERIESLEERVKELSQTIINQRTPEEKKKAIKVSEDFEQLNSNTFPEMNHTDINNRLRPIKEKIDTIFDNLFTLSPNEIQAQNDQKIQSLRGKIVQLINNLSAENVSQGRAVVLNESMANEILSEINKLLGEVDSDETRELSTDFQVIYNRHYGPPSIPPE